MGFNSSFADILRQAKAQSQLRGTFLGSKDVKSIGQGYFSSALDASNTDRAYNLANAQQTLAEKAEAADEDQFNKLYNLSNSQFAQSLAQQRASMDAQMDAANKAQMQGYANTGLQAVGTGATLLKGTDFLPSISQSLFAPTAAEAALKATAPDAAAILADMGAAQLPGYGGSAGANAALAGTATGSGLLGNAGGVLGSGLSTLGTMGASLAGTVAPKLVDAIHKDSMENLGHNLTFGLAHDEQTAQTVGSGATGAAAGAITGAALTAWSGPGAIVGAIVGGISGMFSCFAAGTPILMADGTTKPVEEIDIFDECDKGGTVTGRGVALSDALYDYDGVLVTGSHAVYEDGEWKRVWDSSKANRLPVEGVVKVYIVNNVNHILIVNGITFADYGEVTDSADMTNQERIDYLNEHCRI